MSVRHAVTFAILLIAAFGSWYLANNSPPDEIIRTTPGSGNDGFYLRSARFLGTDETGQLLYEIQAEYAEQQANDEIELKNVRIRYTPTAGVPWVINADFATVSNIDDTTTHLLLNGNVIVISNEGFSGEATEIRTAALDIDPVNYTAETQSSVQIRIGSHSLNATGMLALLKDNRLQLKSNVSGRFVP